MPSPHPPTTAATATKATLAATALLGALVLWPATAQADTWQLLANLNATAVMFSPAPREDVVDVANLDLLNQPEASQWQTRDTAAEVGNGGWAQARFAGRVGTLKAFAASSYPYCCTIDGVVVTTGYTGGTVNASFYDTVVVSGAGLAVGTPVQYRVDFDISGNLSRPVFELGGHLSVYGLAEVRLRDMLNFQEVSLSWDAVRQDTGRYSLTLDTVVGHSLGLSGRLVVGASVDAYALTARYAEADFYSTASFQLAPSVAGLNTVGASGVDFLAPVPEPAAWGLMALGLVALGALRAMQGGRLRRCGLAAC